jgi:hypothetical protein
MDPSRRSAPDGQITALAAKCSKRQLFKNAKAHSRLLVLIQTE